MKRKTKEITCQQVLDFLKAQSRPAAAAKIAQSLGAAADEVQECIDALTYCSPRMAEDGRGRVYIKKEGAPWID
jgi:predicted transcriptional regulator